MNRAGGYVEDLEIALPDNPEWSSFKLRLQEITEATAAQWEQFQRNQFGPPT